ncbi:MAG: peptidoglycan DD-metalloendopeptidase family protein [Desertifilum sp.]|nr:peptidoglycan DD-metalloendopeptidase family protein [Desertifilum sp.]
MKRISLFVLRYLVLLLKYSTQSTLTLLFSLVLVTQMQNSAKADPFGLSFGVLETSETVALLPLESEVELPNSEDPYVTLEERGPPETAFAPLEVATPYLIDETPPGSYDFTLLRNDRDDVEIPSPCTGTVTYTKYSPWGYGNRVEVLCEESGYAYFMGHLEAIAVTIGQHVTLGQSLGTQGSTGNSTGPHVHLEIGRRPYLEFYPENRISDRAITMPLVEAYFRMVENPPLLNPTVAVEVLPEPEPELEPVAIAVEPFVGLDFSVPTLDEPTAKDLALSFEVAPEPTPVPEAEPLAQTPVPEAEPLAQTPVPEVEPLTPIIPQSWWEQASDSPLAIAIGAAEGTRQPNGTKNPAYYWHVDPGNGVDNFGTFSYQHLPYSDTNAVASVNSSSLKREIAAEKGLPEKADDLQLRRLQGFHDELLAQAQAVGLELNQAELVNGLDLANQSPAAGLYAGGYIDRLAQMKQLVSDPDEQILEARIWSYWDMQRNRWDAPGLGNTYDSIRHDQQRRMTQVNLALELQTQSALG